MNDDAEVKIEARSTMTAMTTEATSSSSTAHSHYLDRLKKLRDQAGLDAKPSSTSSAYRIAAVAPSSYEQENVAPNEADPDSNNVDDLRKRLERIKHSVS